MRIKLSALTGAGTDSPWKRVVIAWVAPVILFVGLLTGCTESGEDAASTTSKSASTPSVAPERAETAERWYDAEHVTRGGPLFAQHCAACHGKGGEGAFTWRQVGPDGKYPPPPLNGTGHAWHHPIQVLGAQIKWGAPGGQGSMPPFGDRLSDDQIVEVIAWFQDRWSDETYAQWLQIELRSTQ